MKFAYQGYPVPSIGKRRQAVVFRPTALIRIIGATGVANDYGLMDTGADDTLLPMVLKGPLGVLPGFGETATISGINGGTITAVFTMVDLELRRGKVAHRWAATVGFHEGYKTILGRFGFFEYFFASFNHRRRIVTIRPNEDLPAPLYPGS